MSHLHDNLRDMKAQLNMLVRQAYRELNMFDSCSAICGDVNKVRLFHAFPFLSNYAAASHSKVPLSSGSSPSSNVTWSRSLRVRTSTSRPKVSRVVYHMLHLP